MQGDTAWPNSITTTTSIQSITGLTQGGYEWRVQHLCSNGEESDFTTPRSFTAQCTIPTDLSVRYVTSNLVGLGWYGLSMPEFSTIKYQVRFRVAGSGGLWDERSVPGNATFEIRGLTNNTNYDWQVRTICADTSTDWSTTNTFYTWCASTLVNSPVVTQSSVALSWYGRGPDVSYNFQWRPTGTTTWTNSLTTTSTTASLTNLNAGSAYEVRVQVICSDGVTAQFSPLVSFTTAACDAPTGTKENLIETRQASVAWDYNSPVIRYAVQWRKEGQSNWPYSLTTSLSQLTLPNLPQGGSIEWRVQRFCAETSSSVFTQPRTFVAQCQPPISLRTNNAASRSASVRWGGSIALSYKYQVRWRTVDIANVWNESTWLINTNAYLIQNLLNNETYEWQVRKECEGGITDWSTSTTFRTNCDAVGRVVMQIGATVGTFSGTGEDSEATYIAQWRQNGELTWGNSTTFSTSSIMLTNLQPKTVYTLRVQKNCSDGSVSSYTSQSFATTDCPIPQYLNEQVIEPSSVVVNWGVSHLTSKSEIQWRISGTSGWPNSVTASQATYKIDKLVPETIYDWRVKELCLVEPDAGFSAPRSFTTGCPPPQQFDVPKSAVSSIYLSIGGFSTIGNQLRWRAKTSSDDWSVVDIPVNRFYASVVGLIPGIVYEWQTQRQCSDGQPGGWSGSLTFASGTCGSTFFSTFSTYNIYSADLRWTLPGPDANYLLQWRRAGETTWPNSVTVLADLPNSLTNAYQIYTLKELTPGTTYEARLRVLCTDGSASDFANFSYFALNFTTQMPCMDFRSVRDGSWSDPATWSCNRVPTRDDDVEVVHKIRMPPLFPYHKVKSIRFGNGGAVNYEQGAILVTGTN